MLNERPTWNDFFARHENTALILMAQGTLDPNWNFGPPVSPFKAENGFFNGDFELYLVFTIPWREIHVPPYTTYIALSTRIQIRMGIQMETVQVMYDN